ncbi:MAG TPA: aminoacyl-tRNA hydrolase [Thermomicrobiales bacterium]|nr:aminoacyl-tRNA hydrolase [Thermomicrobiales bacterium]HRA31651.1 aminoacyl-tRNA hydrolase [Thermomicrobiales bacterium]
MRQERSDVWLIVGLGNPGRRYEGTRHNAGFMVLNRLRSRLPAGTTRSRFQSEICETRLADQRLVLAMPQTFMNESGVAVAELARWYKVPRDRLLVVSDDLDLPFGSIRLRGEGSDGGHNGVASIIHHLRSSSFPRLRVGISRPATGPTVPYVLSPFSPAERQRLGDVLDLAADAIVVWLQEGLVPAMNQFNRKPTIELTADVPPGSR